MSGKWIVDAVVDALRLGKAMEREAIVAWLGQSGMFLSGVAAAIERGDHLRSDNDRPL